MEEGGGDKPSHCPNDACNWNPKATTPPPFPLILVQVAQIGKYFT